VGQFARLLQQSGSTFVLLLFGSIPNPLVYRRAAYSICISPPGQAKSWREEAIENKVTILVL
jgi:hypothetical protein